MKKIEQVKSVKKVRILVVEDERIVSMDIQRRLKALGYEVVGAAVSGEEAIEKAGIHRPNLVLMDIMLDGRLDGIAAAEAIRAQYRIPVIYLTAYADSDTLQRAKVTEPFGYVLKPFEERELHGHIEIALYKHRMERRLKESEERYMLATRGANDGLWDWDLYTNDIYFSPRWKAMLGFNEDEIGQEPTEWLDRVHPTDSTRVRAQLTAHLKDKSPHFESEYRILCKDGTYRWMLTRGMALRDGEGNASRMAGSQSDITERKVYDPLTGLPNRTLFIDRIQTAVERSQRHRDSSFAVLAVNLDDFRVAVDGLGYANRDDLLMQIAGRFQKELQPGDTIACLGEDNFGIVLGEIRNATKATEVASALLQGLAQPFQLGKQELYVHASIGIALSTTGYTEAEDLVRDASTAMHRAKAAGKSQSEIFDEDMRSTVAIRIKREADLRRALERSELEVYYQPIMSLANGKIAGFEALIRWQHRDGLLLPKDFIPLAEQSDLIIPIERFVLRKAAEQLCEMQRRRQLAHPITVSVNISARHYGEPDLVDVVKKVLESTGLDPHLLKLEITETALMDCSENVAATLQGLNDLKIQLAMDDFGTGYSSLSYLHQFPIKILKIDRSFVSKLGLKSESRKIVQTIVALGKTLGMETTAEGVENTRQMIELQAFDCTYAQGFLFSEPLTYVNAEELLKNDKSWLLNAGEPEAALQAARAGGS